MSRSRLVRRAGRAVGGRPPAARGRAGQRLGVVRVRDRGLAAAGRRDGVRAGRPADARHRRVGAQAGVRQPGPAVPARHARAADAAALRDVPVHQHRGLAGHQRHGRRRALDRGAVLRRRRDGLPAGAAGRGARPVRRRHLRRDAARRHRRHAAGPDRPPAGRRGRRPAGRGAGDRAAEVQPGAGPARGPGGAGAAAGGRGVRVLRRVRHGRHRRRRDQHVGRRARRLTTTWASTSSAASSPGSRSSWRRSAACTSRCTP